VHLPAVSDQVSGCVRRARASVDAWHIPGGDRWFGVGLLSVSRTIWPHQRTTGELPHAGAGVILAEKDTHPAGRQIGVWLHWQPAERLGDPAAGVLLTTGVPDHR